MSNLFGTIPHGTLSPKLTRACLLSRTGVKRTKFRQAHPSKVTYVCYVRRGIFKSGPQKARWANEDGRGQQPR